MQECATPPVPTREEALASPHLGVNLACLFRGCLENAVRKFYPRDLRLWPVLGGMKFEAKITPSRLVVVVLRPHLAKVDIVGGRVTAAEMDPPSPESAPQKVATPAGHRGLRKVFEVEDDGVVFLMPPLRAIAEDIQGLWNAWTPAERADILAPQIVLNVEVQHRFLYPEAAPDKEAPVLPFSGRVIQRREAARELGFSLAETLKEKIDAARPGDPLHVLKPGQPGRVKGGRGYFRDAVLYAKERMKSDPQRIRDLVSAQGTAIQAAVKGETPDLLLAARRALLGRKADAEK